MTNTQIIDLNTKNKTGSKTEPWGTPLATSRVEEVDPAAWIIIKWPDFIGVGRHS